MDEINRIKNEKKRHSGFFIKKNLIKSISYKKMTLIFLYTTFSRMTGESS